LIFLCYNIDKYCIDALFTIKGRWKTTMPSIIKLQPNDRIKLKKKHPCGGDVFRIVRVGSEVRIICESCGRDMTMERIKLEKAIKQMISSTPN